MTADEPRPILRPIPRWVISVGLPVMVLVAVAVTWLLLAFALGGDQLDAIRTGGTLGVGLGGAVALWLAVRKQRSTKLDLLQKYEAHQLAERAAAHTEKVAAENHAHQLRLAADAHEDATARRITELYGKGVDQLGSDKAPVRLGGLYALERLGQDSDDPRLRQTIVNVICAYLRMPPEGEWPQESEVRLTAQRLLEHHTRPGPGPDPVSAFWPDIDLDLTGAELVDVDLSGCRLRTIRLRSAQLTGRASFLDTQVTGEADFGAAEFSWTAGFDGARFDGPARFGYAVFADDAEFEDAVFAGETSFSATEFERGAIFRRAEFGGIGSFVSTRFGDYTTFNRVAFAQLAEFEAASFAGYAGFRRTRFAVHANFTRAEFCGDVVFDEATFAGPPDLGRAKVRADREGPVVCSWPPGWAAPGLDASAPWARLVQETPAPGAHP
ncbi:pentapeptide repeat-containing protein [Amycolatopsis saalfeldensis]|uniref:pentapeptide repeat-containing protein n=1 Tax=Amycolatopsis saalfeldensis TaxID=394193 RepID=UPI0015A4F605|nr:pentapeptide repeat-containing protein [Amycolatopsis saalfeldensis]